MAEREIKERKKRQIDEITDSDKVFALIKAHLAQQPLLIKGDSGGVSVQIVKVDPANQLILANFSAPVQFPENAIKLYKVLGRYVELDCSLGSMRGEKSAILKVHTARIARFARAHPRYPVRPEQAYIRNIRTAKNTIITNAYSIPTSVKVNLRGSQQQNAGLADVVRIGTFDEVSEEKFRVVQKSQKALMIKDTQDVESYLPETDDFMDYQHFLGIEMGEVMNKYKLEKIVSEIIAPINYIDHNGQSIPLGYIQIISHSEKFDMFKYLEVMELCFSIVDKIRDSNTVVIKEKQEVLDMSEGGLKAKIEHPDLVRYLVHQAGFTFDVVFKMQQPLTFSGRICTTSRDEEGNLLLGIQLQGSGTRKGELERYVNYVNTFIKKG